MYRNKLEHKLKQMGFGKAYQNALSETEMSALSDSVKARCINYHNLKVTLWLHAQDNPELKRKYYKASKIRFIKHTLERSSERLGVQLDLAPPEILEWVAKLDSEPEQYTKENLGSHLEDFIFGAE